MKRKKDQSIYKLSYYFQIQLLIKMTQTPSEKGKAKNWPLQVVYNPSEDEIERKEKKEKRKRQ